MTSLSPEVMEFLRTHLAGQFERANVILMTGAGFSTSACNVSGATIPTYPELRDRIWEICFPGSEIDLDSSLPYLYEHALVRHKGQLRDLLIRQLTVDSETLPGWYETAFSMPWFRIYTLNADDLEVAVARRFALPRPIVSISGTELVPGREAHGQLSTELEVVHLNGTIDDAPERTTFSPTQYGERLAGSDVWFARLAADLTTHAVVFVGTKLDEPPLWQQIEQRLHKGGDHGTRELRPRSYLVTPHLDRARQALLAEFNVIWIPASAEEFVSILSSELRPQLDAGQQLIARSAGPRGARNQLLEVGTLAAAPVRRTDFLLGQEPTWSDIQSGRAIVRDVDQTVAAASDGMRADPAGGLVSIVGTAGSGKSSTLMREALRLTAAGVRVGWVDRETDLTTRQIRDHMRAADGPDVLAIDDGETFGSELASLVKDVVDSNRPAMVLVAVRAGRVDFVLNPVRMGSLGRSEIGMPPLSDSDIDLLIGALDRDNKLGVLRALDLNGKRQAFRDQAGRQLLVALYQATSGFRFEDKVTAEFDELEPPQKVVYALVTVASALGYSMSPDEILIAAGDKTNATLNVVDRLVARHVLVTAGTGPRLRSRHRVVARLLLEELNRRGQLSEVMQGLALVAASKVSRGLPRSSRPWRFLRSILNHDFLMKVVGVEVARNMYGSVEDVLNWDYHYWLQRGSLEVELGNIPLAENFLGQARALGNGDPYIENEWAYLLYKKALANPRAIESPRIVDEARAILEELVRTRGKSDPYPYHVIGSQGLSWARRGIVDPEDRRECLRSLLAVVEDGLRKHPRVNELEVLVADIRREYMEGAVRSTDDFETRLEEPGPPV